LAVPEDGFLFKAMANASPSLAVLNRWQRAGLKPKGSYDQWFEAGFDRKRRKEYRRLQARLSEQGAFGTASFTPGDDVASWTGEFLSLEASGWKGKRGTAIHSNEDAAQALRDGLQALAQSGKLRFWKLALDGRPLAMLFAVVERGEAWLFKIAYDETFSRYSPGVLLVLHATRQLFEEGVTKADSCAIPDHPMIDNIWRDRLSMADMMIAGPGVSQFEFAMAVARARAQMNLRSRLRDVYYWLTDTRRS
jgi:CelD/BcsL family acetyltransferase involved in cellulose biosynthesis